MSLLVTFDGFGPLVRDDHPTHPWTFSWGTQRHRYATEAVAVERRAYLAKHPNQWDRPSPTRATRGGLDP